MNGYKCFRCRTAPSEGESAFCAACAAESEAEREKREAANRAVEYPSCWAKVGQPCITGSGVMRLSAHASREKAAERAVRLYNKTRERHARELTKKIAGEDAHAAQRAQRAKPRTS